MTDGLGELIKRFLLIVAAMMVGVILALVLALYLRAVRAASKQGDRKTELEEESVNEQLRRVVNEELRRHLGLVGEIQEVQDHIWEGRKLEMTEKPTLINLRKALAKLYPTVRDSRRVVVDAGLDPEHITFDDKAINNWFYILEEAQKQGKVPAIVAVAFGEYPGNEELSRISLEMTVETASTVVTAQFRAVDFVLVTALEEERDAVLDRLPGHRKLPPSKEDIRTYFQADLPVTFSDGQTGVYQVVVMPLLGMGRVQAAMATADAIRRWHPRYIMLVGIAGGIADRGVRIGDILISDQIVDYELQKVTQLGHEVRWEIQRADPRLLNACKNFMEESWQEQIRTKRPDSGKPQCHTGPIASGDKVIAFGEILAQYRGVWPKLIGVEMEAAGVATATFQSSEKPGFFMVRCVSDLADEQKGSSGVEKWRPYACEAAASFAIALLKSGPVSLNENTNVIARKELPPNARRPEQLPTVQVTILLESDIQEFTPTEREGFIFALSRIANINPDQIRILRVAHGSVEVTLEMPEEAAHLLVSMYLAEEPQLRELRIAKVELRQIIAPPNELQVLKQRQQQQLIKKQDKALVAVQHARDTVLGRVSAAYQDSVRVLLSALDEHEVHIVQTIVENADQNQLTDAEMEEILKAIQQGYKELQEKALPIFTSDTEIQESENLTQAWKSPDISAGGKFKLSVPIIPKLLTYETELSINVKEFLKKFWARFSKKK